MGDYASEHITPNNRDLWWLSFVDPARCAPDGQGEPGGPGFLGVAIVAASDLLSAVRETHRLGCNPGGEVLGHGPFPIDTIPARYFDRLLTKAEIDAIDNESEETER